MWGAGGGGGGNAGRGVYFFARPLPPPRARASPRPSPQAVYAQRDKSMEDARDVAAEEAGLNYIGLDGNIGCVRARVRLPARAWCGWRPWRGAAWEGAG